MTTKHFTKEEIESLKQNPFTYKVTENVIGFTVDFKELFWTYYKGGMRPMEIFVRTGYDPSVLGERRIGNFAHKLREAMKSGKGFNISNGRGLKPKPKPKKYDEMLPEVAIASMNYELKYLRQEVEFLKKLYALETRKKQGK
ncbi:MAG: transposase [Phascolarctobacterium sp.]|nr:transposase [Phascolarctobacterium sp.]